MSYPYVTSYDRPAFGHQESFHKNEGFFVKYIMKPQPQTVGDYVFTVSPGVNFKVCKIEVTHVGDNMPCTEEPGPTLHGYENTMVQYAGGNTELAHECGEEAAYTFKVIIIFLMYIYIFSCIFFANWHMNVEKKPPTLSRL